MFVWSKVAEDSVNERRQPGETHPQQKYPCKWHTLVSQRLHGHDGNQEPGEAASTVVEAAATFSASAAARGGGTSQSAQHQVAVAIGQRHTISKSHDRRAGGKAVGITSGNPGGAQAGAEDGAGVPSFSQTLGEAKEDDDGGGCREKSVFAGFSGSAALLMRCQCGDGAGRRVAQHTVCEADAHQSAWLAGLRAPGLRSIRCGGRTYLGGTAAVQADARQGDRLEEAVKEQ
ncbi:hypothetical protein K490DRAFT_60077 [Saccharata proteae CBS 121410]|uniref:Uncharacterized protein n=1 Tax=Saccharata proteae CBS 121410 TaxID=1314787 RepID=A0A9P4LVA2_9PEZI|nr:hypothetical protein K490DRAFT_60077 [Saccharata proteae CBS 121410]